MLSHRAPRCQGEHAPSCALNKITAVLLVSLYAFSRADAAKIDV